MHDLTYFALCGLCVAAVLMGINMMSKVKSSVAGNGLSAAAMVLAMAIVFFPRVRAAEISLTAALLAALAAGAFVGIYRAAKAKMISMPQIIALLNGLGGGASALVAAVTAVDGGVPLFEAATAGLALAIGSLTLTGSLIAAGKLARILDARPRSLPHHGAVMAVMAAVILIGIVMQTVVSGAWVVVWALAAMLASSS